MSETSKKAYALRKIRKLSSDFADEICDNGNSHKARLMKDELKQLIREYAKEYYNSESICYIVGYTNPEINRGNKFLVQFEIRDNEKECIILKVIDVIPYDYETFYSIF